MSQNFEVLMSKLTPRQQQICKTIKEDPNLTLRGIGNRLGVSHHTVDFHLRQVYSKTGVHNKTALVATLCKDPNTPT